MHLRRHFTWQGAREGLVFHHERGARGVIVKQLRGHVYTGQLPLSGAEVNGDKRAACLTTEEHDVKQSFIQNACLYKTVSTQQQAIKYQGWSEESLIIRGHSMTQKMVFAAVETE